jgi:phosphate:Na+ symporter
MFMMIGTVVGGIGLFLLGMILMTDGLKALAGDALRSILARFTTNRFSAIGAGAGVTALVQSSSATTLATIGFVSAGLLSFQNAIGVNIGAALGTTSTGWLVSLLGLKLSIGKLMLPIIGIGALAKLLGKGRVAQIGMALAGFGTIFVGIDTLQAGMEDLAQQFNPESFPQATIMGRLLLVLIGVGMTVVMQSSSAAVATTLAALAGGTINLEQAASLVIGQNMGTSVTAAIASIGASTPARRTALAHVMYNVSTGTIALLMMPVFLGLVETATDSLIFDDDALTIAAFHTAFNVVGVLVFLPLIPRMARLVERVVKARGPRLTQHLDPTLAAVPPVAIEAARRVLKDVATELFLFMTPHLLGRKKPPPVDALTEFKTALKETRSFLAKIPPPETQGYEFHRQISTVHALDHLYRMADDATEINRIGVARHHKALRATCEDLAAVMETIATEIRTADVEPDVERAAAFSQRLADERRSARPAILEATAARTVDPDTALAELAAQRWLDRIAYHVWRTSYHLREMTRKEHLEQAKEAENADDNENNDTGMPSESGRMSAVGES